MTIFWAVAFLIGAYLAGAIPTGYWIGLRKGIDVRTVGSGSIGATNVLRSVGKKEALFVFFFDIFKGFLPVYLAMGLEQSAWSTLGLPPFTIPVLVAFMPIIGHSRSVFLNFQGGKSAATGLGTFIGLNAAAAGLIFLTWLVVLGASRIVSLASIAASIASPFIFYFCGSPPAIVGFAIAGSLFVIVRHQSNMKRLLNGTEPRIGQKAKELTQENAASQGSDAGKQEGEASSQPKDGQ